MLQRGIGGEVQAVGGRQQGYRTGLLIAVQNRLHVCEIKRGAQNSALRPFIPGEHPQAVLPFVIHDVMYVANRMTVKTIGDIPGSALIFGNVNVDLVAMSVVEIFPPENLTVRSCGDMQRTSTARDPVRDAKLSLARRKRCNHTGQCSAPVPRRQHGECVKTVPQQAAAERKTGADISPQAWAEVCNFLPMNRRSAQVGP